MNKINNLSNDLSNNLSKDLSNNLFNDIFLLAKKGHLNKLYSNLNINDSNAIIFSSDFKNYKLEIKDTINMLYNCYLNDNYPSNNNNNKNRIYYIFNLFIKHLIEDIKMDKLNKMINIEISNNINSDNGINNIDNIDNSINNIDNIDNSINNIDNIDNIDNSINNIDNSINNIDNSALFNVNENKAITFDNFVKKTSKNQKQKILPQKKII